MPVAGAVVTSLTVCKYGIALRKISPCFPDPRLGIDPRLPEKESVSSVRFSSRTLSDAIGGTNAVGVFELLGRKMVLNPRPTQVPTNATSGPRFAGSGA